MVERPTRTGWEAIVALALDEDLGVGDITSLSTVAAGTLSRGTIVAKAPGVISGLAVASDVFRRVDASISFVPLLEDGQRVTPGRAIADVAGPARGLLAGERVALNLLQRLSGVATLTAAYVAAVEGTAARIVDTRKTTPGMRVLEKAAVRHGGGQNHRFGLADGILIKDNHLAAVGGRNRVRDAVRLARERAPHTLRIEVEVTTLEEVGQALTAEADVILLDNMDPPAMRHAVGLIGGRALIEASGGITLDTVRAVAETGVALISVGALTHSAAALDLSLEFDLDQSNQL